MGFFNKLFGGRKEYPEIDAASPAARRLGELKQPLESLLQEVKDPVEVVPVGPRPLVFIGKPPKRFGLAWIEGERVKNLKNLAEEHSVAPDRMGRIVDELRRAYQQCENEPRFQMKLGDRTVVVAPSERLEHEVEEILHRVES
ncbi:MAG: hypothetical protein Kow0092_21190 [Deferrisomatales bacterium]